MQERSLMRETSPGGENSGWPGSRSINTTMLACFRVAGPLDSNALEINRQNVDFPALLGPQTMIATGRLPLFANNLATRVCQSGGGSRRRSDRLYGSSSEDITYF